MSPKAQLEQEKRIRREIANSNERRRMQCINAGFQSLRALMPQLSGEKLSKAAILQHTTEYIANIEQEKKRLLSQNDQLKHMLMELGRERDSERQNDSPPPPKRKKRDTESSDEGISMVESTSDGSKDLPSVDELHREMVELRNQLDRERLVRIMLEDRARSLEAQLYHTQRPHHLSSSQMPAPVNLKVTEIHGSKSSCNVQEISAHADDRQHTPAEPRFHTAPRRNLENLVEAIRQIEGDRVLSDDHKFLAEERHTVLNSEESEKESSVSDPEESKSESSGRDSPSPLGLCARQLAMSASMAAAAAGSTPQMAHPGSFSEKYPIASHLLHRPSFPQYYRPGVIVHKS